VALFVALLLIALLFGIGGLFTALKWLLIIALVLLVVSYFSYPRRY
jgi:hypothetical protein